MSKKTVKMCLIIILAVASFVSYLKYMDTHDFDRIRRVYHHKVITVEELNNYIEEKELLTYSYDPLTNYLTGKLTDSAKTKYGLPEDSNGLVRLGGVVELIEEGKLTNETIIDKVEKTIEYNSLSYIRSFIGTCIIGLVSLFLFQLFRKRTIVSMGLNSGFTSPSSFSSNSSPALNDIEVEEKTGIKLDDVKGHDEIKDDISFIIKMLKNPEKYEKVGAKVPKGVLLFGPPGTGKTMIAKAIANEVGIPFFAAGGSDFVEKYVGVGAKRVRELFREAKKQDKAIIYIDEIDAIGRKRGDNDNDERTSTLNALLMEMDGFDKSDNILVIASTNRVDVLDDALLRPGRFDKHIAVNPPDLQGRLDILKLYAKNKRLDKDVDMQYIAKITRGFSGAELANLLNEAAMLTAFRDKDKTTMIEIDDAYYKIVTKGDKKKDFDRSTKDTEITAWHEAGHAIVSWILAGQRVNKVTIIPSTSGAGGITLMEPKEGDYYSKKDLENMVKVSYGGRAAEYLLLGSEDGVTTGASSDIEKATNIIMSMLGCYGMSEKFGLLNLEKMKVLNQEYLLTEAKEVSNRLYKETIDFLNEHYALLKEMSEVLIDKETITEYEVESLINKHIQPKEQNNIRLVEFSNEEENEESKGKVFKKFIPEKLVPDMFKPDSVKSKAEKIE